VVSSLLLWLPGGKEGNNREKRFETEYWDSIATQEI
jgi:hypothetical protein